MKRATGLKDSAGVEIHEGDRVSLGGNMTADDSLGLLPWSLMLGVDPDSAYNIKYMNHAVSLLHSKSVRLVTDAEGE